MNKIIKTVQITEAEQNLSELLEQVEQDKVVIRIQRRDRTVAVLAPYDDFKKKHDADKACMRELLEEGINLGTEPFSREEAYDRS